jgi:murein DD-endopeptidase / murein LD-carboxypeptidase
MIRYSIIVGLIAFANTLLAQDPISTLIDSNAGDAEMVRRLKVFAESSIEKPFDHGQVSSDQFLNKAKSYLGTPYKFGGMSKSGIDCSGLIAKTMADVGLSLPHDAQELAKYGTIILDRDDLQPGDIIFFTKTYKTSKLVSHAGFVLEDGKMIHASSSKGVMITNIKNPYYWDKYYLFGTRIFGGAGTSALAKGETVIAGIYNVGVRGKYTDSGEKYSAGSLTASHPTLPFGTHVRVTNPANGKSVEVVINDGDTGRDTIVLTLSKAAAKKLKMKKDTTLEVKIEVIK